MADDVDLRAVAERAPGFVAADLVAVRREAAVLRQHCAATATSRLTQKDLLDAVGSVRPISMSSSETLQTGGITLDQVGDMAEVKQGLTEAVIWPLSTRTVRPARHPGAPGRGRLRAAGMRQDVSLRALAGTGRSTSRREGRRLLDKSVGESERAVRELFRRAPAAPPSSSSSTRSTPSPHSAGLVHHGVADRVVAALLTEMDGAEPLRDVRRGRHQPGGADGPRPARPGRLERLIYVPPPDAAARADILRAAGRNTPLAGDVDLAALGADLEGYSAADCAAVLREAALTAMRESFDGDGGDGHGGPHIAVARAAVPPSLDPAQLATLAAYAKARATSASGSRS